MSTDTTEAELEAIDLDMDPEEELKKIQEMEDEEKAEGEESEGEESEGEESEGEESEGEESEGEESEGEESEGEEDPGDANKLLAELQAERERLQAQLQEMTQSSQADRRRLELIEQNILLKDQQQQPAPTPEAEGPTPEQIVAHLDRRIAAVDAALTEAENSEDPSQAPALRTQLRQLERYYNNFVSQQQLLAAQGPNPEDVIQQAVQETKQQQAFSSTKDYITQEFPILDVNNEYFDEGLRDQVHRIYNPMIANGASPQEALAEAVLLVTRAHGVEPASVLRQQHYDQQQQQLAQTEQAEQAMKATLKQGAKARKGAAVKKNVAADGATPPSLSDVGAAGGSKGIIDKYDFGSMSIEEVMRMSDSEMEQIEGVLAMHGD